MHINEIHLGANPIFDGTDITITAKPGPLGGDGLVAITSIEAAGLTLGKVKVNGDLSNLDAGKTGGNIGSISVHSTSGLSVWYLAGSVGSLNVTKDLRDVEIHIDDANATLGSLKIGGSLIGEAVAKTGFLSVQNGTIAKISIGGGIEGGLSTDSGAIFAKNIGTASIGRDIIGGTGNGSGRITVSSSLGSLTVKGDVNGGTGQYSGSIHSTGSLGNVTIKGSLVGGATSYSGSIDAFSGMGFITIGHDQIGGAFSNSGDIQNTNGGIKGVTIGGSLIGGSANYSGRIVTLGGDIGPIKIGGDLHSTVRDSTGLVLADTGIIFARTGTNGDATKSNITSVTVGGSVIGGGSNSVSQIFADGSIGSVKIGRDLRGGFGTGSGSIVGYNGLGAVKVGGSVIAGAGGQSGAIQAVTGPLTSVTVGGSISGGAIFAWAGLGNVTIAGDLTVNSANGSGSITSLGTIGAIKIGGSIKGTVGVNASISANPGSADSLMAIKSLTVNGRVENATISAGVAVANPDVKIGAVKVGGDWIASNLVVGVQAGADGKFGTADDSAQTQVGEPDTLFSKIASIVIGGKVYGTAGGSDHFGFVSEEIGSMTVNGVKVPLTAGHSTDADVTNTHFILGDSRDVTVHEVA